MRATLAVDAHARHVDLARRQREGVENIGVVALLLQRVAVHAQQRVAVTVDAHAFEAVVGAIYLDAGFEACRAVVLPLLEPHIDGVPAGGVGKDPKTRLQEWLQARQRPLPAYELLSESGEEHARIFHVRCQLSEPALEAEGSGSSRRAAEQDAAAAILAQLEPKKP